MKKEAAIGLGLAGAAIVVLVARAKAEPEPPPAEYSCPYCTETFTTLEELRAHIETVHPGERLPIDIFWE